MMKQSGWRQKFQQFMYGRYGMDELGRFCSDAALILLIVTLFVRISILYILVLLVLILMYYRFFSKQIYKRAAENQKYMQMTAGIRKSYRKLTGRLADKSHRYYRCPFCKQEIRVPRGKGKIKITCPKCKKEFIKRT